MNHVRAMTEYEYNKETDEVEIAEVTESGRLTGFAVHALIASTLGLLPLLGFVPIPVVAGVFLFLGRKLMTGNSFLNRLKDMFAEKSRLPDDHPIKLMGRKRMNNFTLIQVACLVGLWSVKQNPATAMFFPSAIGVLMLIRALVLPRFYSEDEFEILGDEMPR
jgi:hypothetical protein